MELTKEQIDKFVELNKPFDGLGGYSESEVKQIAKGVAGYYIALLNIYKRIKQNGDEICTKKDI